ncbi:unnamed protein product [Arctogadus glacialis]
MCLPLMPSLEQSGIKAPKHCGSSLAASPALRSTLTAQLRASTERDCEEGSSSKQPRRFTPLV